MLLVASLAPFVLLATKVAANPLFTRDSPSPVFMNITKRINLNNNGKLDVIQKDQARLAVFAHKSGASKLDTNPDLSLSDSVFVYMANTAIGSPPSYCEPCQFLPYDFLYAHIRQTYR